MKGTTAMHTIRLSLQQTNLRPQATALAAGLLVWMTSGPLHAADPVITNPNTTSISVVTGGDVGEGLDLEGNFKYALSIGAEADFSTKIRDATFLGLIDAEVPGATVVAGNRILNWYVVNYGDSSNDDALKSATSSIRWSDANNATTPEVTLTLENLKVGVQYKFQMLFGEQCCNRGFDIFFDDQLVVKDLNPGVVHGGIAQGSQEALVTHLYSPAKSTVVIRFDGREASSDYPDHNAILNAVTVEELGVELDSDKDGMPDSWETKYAACCGLNPNDPADAAKDCNGNGITNLDEFKRALDPCDTTKPEVRSASTTATFDTVKITFSKDLDPSTATNVANYTISPTLAITKATYKSKVVTLTTAKQTAGAVAYKVTVNGVKDVSNFDIPADKNSASFYSYILNKDGVLKFSYWGAINGTPIDNLTSDPRYPATPDLVGAVFSINSRDIFADDSHENYGATMEGFLTPTESGSYRFFIRSDDASQLWLSTDDKEANLVMIAEQTGCCNAFTEPDSPLTSEPVALTANKKYFIRMIYKEGGGGDYGQVAWRKEGSSTSAGALTPIPGKFLSAAVDLPVPAEGIFTTLSPAVGAKNVSPNPYLNIVHRDGKTPWTTESVGLKLDGNPVQATITKDGPTMSIVYQVPTLLQSLSTHTLALDYPDPTGNRVTMTWPFTVFKYSGPTKDSIKGYAGLLVNNAAYSPDAGGRTGKAGDFAIDFGSKGSAWVDIKDVSYINAAAVKDELSMALWVKKYDIANNSAFWAQLLTAPKTGTDTRGFQAHIPWGDNTIYFDTAGCCDGTLQRISANISTWDDYNAVGNNDWWKKWHHFVFTKKADQKNIYIDGKLFLNGSSADPLPLNFMELALGTDGLPGGDYLHGLIDDFAVYSTEVSAADAAKLAGGAAPTAISATLVAYWDFNDASTGAAASITQVTVSADKKSFTITYVGTLQESATVTAGWTDVPGATSPANLPIGPGTKFYRVK